MAEEKKQPQTKQPQAKKLTIDEMATFCKRKGFVYQNSEIYGGMSGFFDYGPLGVELKNNIKHEWWKAHVRSRADVVGIDGSIITHPKVWEASGHVANFTDIMARCGKCGNSTRADHLVEDKTKAATAGMNAQQLQEAIAKNKIKCPRCGSDQLKIAQPFNLMFKTTVGPSEGKEAEAYLRPETAQLIFANFKLVQENARMKLPFGIAQIGKAFRNEISPRDFLFRCREFEQMEIEYFVHPNKIEKCPYVEEFYSHDLNVLTSEMQKKKDEQHKKMKVKEMLDKKLILPWHAYWLAFEHNWFVGLGAKSENLRIRQHVKEEKSHYATDTWDLEYNFPFGWKELEGTSNRSDYDLQQHIKASGKDLSYFDPETSAKVVPHVVAEPSLGVDRTFLVFLFDAYEYDSKRENIVLHLNPKLAPIKIAVFPLLSNKEELVAAAKKIYDELRQDFSCFYDENASIGRRYARMDEVGTPFCVTFDFDSLKDHAVTIRDRDTTKQARVKIKELPGILWQLLSGKTSFDKL
ncbi:glycine--tRNA ligase [Candidatus Woesearchaeota archaeon]|nr:glycine--tRNA ligase [Candidatus Woesearchaeota archaeon]